MGNAYILNREYEPLREAWLAAHFALALQEGGHTVELQMRAEDEQFPDFYLHFNEKELQFEVTEVMAFGRRRNDEYRALQGNATAAPPPTWVNERDSISLVATAIERKAAKGYPAGTHLLVYVDFQGPADPRECHQQANGACRSFDSVWLAGGAGCEFGISKLFDRGTFPHEQYMVYRTQQRG
jgi:hypothetical protein